MDRVIPNVGDVYVRWDGETVQVVGLGIDAETGEYIVEYEADDGEAAKMVGLGHWLGIEITAPWPHPRRFLPDSEFEPEEYEGEEPSSADKLAVLSKAIEASEAMDSGPPSIGKVEPEDDG